MRALNRKLVRDLLSMKAQVFAIALVMAAGVAMLTMSLSTLDTLSRAQQAYYERYRFAEVFAQVKRAPQSLAERIAEIPGVARVQTRTVLDVTLDMPGLLEPAVGRLISVPEDRRPLLNDLHIRRGGYIEPTRRNEVLVSEAFAEAHELEIGDTITAIINGRQQELRVAGVAMSPEYIYEVQPTDIIPDAERFGVMWMAERELEAAYDMEGAFNDVTLTLTPGASEQEVIDRLDRLTERYGGVGAYGREDQVSHRFVRDEMQQLRVMAILPPAIFLSVAAFLVNVVLSRVISLQREQIAAIKAFGYTPWEIGAHYIKLVAVITVLGVAMGTAVGGYLGAGMTEMYAEFFRFPVFEFRLARGVVLLSLAVTFGASAFAVWGAVRKAASLPPAEAMQPEPPPKYRPTLIERLGLQRLLSQPARMILRRLERKPLRAALSTFGISLAAAVLVVSNFSIDAVGYLLNFQFALTQRQDVTVTFIEPRNTGALHEVANLPGVLHAEPFRTVPVRLRHEHRERSVAIEGLPRDATLRRVLDDQLRHVELPADGLVLSQTLAEILNVNVGDTLTIEVLEGERPTRQVVVTAVVAEFVGLSSYMEITALNRLMRKGTLLSGALLQVDSQQLPQLYTELKRTPQVAGVSVKQAALASFEQTLAENLLRMRTFTIGFAAVIAIGVVYNSARVTLSERSRELASMRVLGFTRGEIAFILLGEMAVLTLIAIPLGLAIGYGLAVLTTAGLATETTRIPTIVGPQTYALAATTVIVAAVASAFLVRRRLDRLDLVAVLKSRE